LSEKLTSKKIKKITQHIFDLPTLPTTVAKIIELVDHPSTTAQTLSRIISSDQALTAQILKLANSSYYGFPQKINTVPLAIVVIGTETLKNMALSVSVIDRFSKFQHSMPFDIYLFWEHAIGTAIASRMLAKEIKYQVSGEIFAAGLLHDLGKYVMSLYFKDDFSKVISKMIDEDKPMFKIEEEVFPEISHAQIGAWLVEKWNLPTPIVMAINYHHNPIEAGEHQEIAWIINFGDYLTKKMGVGYSGDMSTPRVYENIHEVLNLKNTESGELDEEYYLKRLEDEINQESSLFSLAKVHDSFAPEHNMISNIHEKVNVSS
jgi:putative nucleotidyltransferase with HDIG domain